VKTGRTRGPSQEQRKSNRMKKGLGGNRASKAVLREGENHQTYEKTRGESRAAVMGVKGDTNRRGGKTGLSITNGQCRIWTKKRREGERRKATATQTGKGPLKNGGENLTEANKISTRIQAGELALKDGSALLKETGKDKARGKGGVKKKGSNASEKPHMVLGANRICARARAIKGIIQSRGGETRLGWGNPK